MFLRLVLGVTQDPLVIAQTQRALLFATYLCLCACAKSLIGQRDVTAARAHLLSVIAGCWLLVFVLYPPAGGLPISSCPKCCLRFC